MSEIHYQTATFIISAVSPRQYPEDVGAEVAFAGRSNAGKSSALNRLTRQKQLARVSKTPGRTQQINFFTINEQCRLVDLPGYGYAQVPEKVRKNWRRMLQSYFIKRASLRGVVLLMDIRHPLTPKDWDLVHFVSEYGLALHIVLTKADKLKRGPMNNTLLQVRREFKGNPNISVQTFSSSNGQGLEELEEKLDSWLVEEAE